MIIDAGLTASSPSSHHTPSSRSSSRLSGCAAQGSHQPMFQVYSVNTAR